MKWVLIAAVLVITFLAVFLGEDKKAKPQVAAPKAPSIQPVAAPAGAPLLKPAWPPVKGEGGAPVSADLFARNYYVVLDGSGSMNDRACSGGHTKMDAAKAALASFSQTVPAHANLGLLVFDVRGVNEQLPLGTNNRNEFTRKVNEVRGNGGTPLRSAIQQAYNKLLDQGARQLGYGEYHLVVVTDGIADGAEDPTPVLNRILAESPIVVQTIGFCIGEKHALNQAGRTIYRAADNVDALRQGLADVLAEAPQFAVTQFK